jgi:hypothetical protein
VKFWPRNPIVPLVALVVLALMLQQTLAALRASGAWQPRSRIARARAEDPYSRVDDLFGENRPEVAPDRLRNPFAFGAAHPAPVAGGPVQHVTPKPVVPPPPPKPTLTSIIWDSDPRATVRYDGKDFSVRVNSLFADFKVKSITSNEVILDRSGETIVLSLRSKGD